MSSSSARSEASEKKTREPSRSESWHLRDRDAEVAQRHLRLGEREGEGAGGDAVVVELLRAIALPPASSAATPVVKETRAKPPGARRSRVRRLRIGSSTAPVVPDSGAPVHRLRIVGAAPAAEEAHPVGLPLDLRLRRSMDGEDVEADHRRVVRGERGRRRASSAVFSAIHSVSTKSLPNAGLATSSASEPRPELDVARELDLARAVAVVGQRDAAHLGVVPGRDGDLEARRDLVVEPLEGRLLGEELHQVALGLLRRGLVGRRPDVAACGHRAGR